MTDNGKLVDDQELLDQMVNDWQSDSAYEESSGGVQDLYTNIVDELTSSVASISSTITGGIVSEPKPCPEESWICVIAINPNTKNGIIHNLFIIQKIPSFHN